MKLVFVAGLLLCLVVVGGCARFTDAGGNSLVVSRSEDSFGFKVAESSGGEQKLFAMLKGSIYETGEYVSVFGTCLDQYDRGYVGSWATMSSWYPNGTVLFSDVNMSEIQTGYFVYQGTMNAVQGTYLTELQCHVPGTGDVAKAFGEWQNPYWVKRISLLNDSLAGLAGQISNVSDQIANISGVMTNLSVDVNLTNLTLQIGNLSVNVTNGFEITWNKIDNLSLQVNDSYNNLTQQISYVATVANASVDRNDSLLANLLYTIIAGTGVPVNHSLYVNTTISPSPPQYFKNVNVYSSVRNEYGVVVGSPLVSCFVSSNNAPKTTVNELMETNLYRCLAHRTGLFL